MYKIQAYNTVSQHHSIFTCVTMTERDKLIQDLLTSGNYTRAGITFEWLAKSGY